MSQETIYKRSIKSFQWITHKNKAILIRDLKELVLNNYYPVNFIQITEFVNLKLNVKKKHVKLNLQFFENWA